MTSEFQIGSRIYVTVNLGREQFLLGLNVIVGRSFIDACLGLFFLNIHTTYVR